MTEIIELPPFDPEAHVDIFETTCRRLRLEQSKIFDRFEFSNKFFDKEGFYAFLETLDGPVVIEPDMGGWRCGLNERDWKRVCAKEDTFPVLKVRQTIDKARLSYCWLEDQGIAFAKESHSCLRRSYVFRCEKDLILFCLSGCEMEIDGDSPAEPTMKGFFTALTDTQKAAALSYDGPEDHGDQTFLTK